MRLSLSLVLSQSEDPLPRCQGLHSTPPRNLYRDPVVRRPFTLSMVSDASTSSVTVPPVNVVTKICTSSLWALTSYLALSSVVLTPSAAFPASLTTTVNSSSVAEVDVSTVDAQLHHFAGETVGGRSVVTHRIESRGKLNIAHIRTCQTANLHICHRHAPLRQSSHQNVQNASKSGKLRIFTHLCSALRSGRQLEGNTDGRGIRSIEVVLVVGQIALDPLPRLIGNERILVPVTKHATLSVVSASLRQRSIKTPVTLNVTTGVPI